MSILLIFSFGILVLFLISQFGGKLTARNSLVWWFIFLFLGWCVVSPASLLPIAHLLGIQLVSNFVLATMILFLAFQAIQESAFTTKQSRKLRDLVTSLAAEAFETKCLDGSKIGTRPRVLVGMPCYNESSYLPVLISDIKKFLKSQANSEYEYIFCIVNDGSSDLSRFILSREFPNGSTHHTSNVGVAGALLTVFKAALQLKANYVIQCDSDGQHPLEEIPNLMAAMKFQNTDLLVGSRFANGNVDESSTRVRRLGSKIITLTIKVLFGQSNITDPTSGFRVYSEKAQRYLLNYMPDEYPEPETIALMLTQGFKIAEIPVTMSARQSGISSLSGFSGIRFMVKVLSALIGLRLRKLL